MYVCMYACMYACMHPYLCRYGCRYVFFLCMFAGPAPRPRVCVCLCSTGVRIRVGLWVPCAALLPAVINAANALCSSINARRRVRPAQRICARQRRRHELPVGNGHRAGSSRMPDSGGRGGEAVRPSERTVSVRRGPTRWSAAGVLLAHSRCRKLLLQR